MKGRPNIHQDNEIILKAQEIFWQKGYYSTSLSDLSTATGAGAGSLYNTFKGGKKQLFKEALLQRREQLAIFREALENSEQPVDLIKKFFLSIADEDIQEHQKGCIVANTIVEMSFMDEELQTEATLILKETEQLYLSVIAEEQKKENIKSKLPAELLARQLITFWLGINSLRRIYADKQTLKDQIGLQLHILD